MVIIGAGLRGNEASDHAQNRGRLSSPRAGLPRRIVRLLSRPRKPRRRPPAPARGFHFGGGSASHAGRSDKQGTRETAERRGSKAPPKPSAAARKQCLSRVARGGTKAQEPPAPGRRIWGDGNRSRRASRRMRASFAQGGEIHGW